MTAASSGVCTSGVMVWRKGYKRLSKVAHIYLPIHGVYVMRERTAAQAVSMTGCSLPVIAAVTVRAAPDASSLRPATGDIHEVKHDQRRRR